MADRYMQFVISFLGKDIYMTSYARAVLSCTAWSHEETAWLIQCAFNYFEQILWRKISKVLMMWVALSL